MLSHLCRSCSCRLLFGSRSRSHSHSLRLASSHLHFLRSRTNTSTSTSPETLSLHFASCKQQQPEQQQPQQAVRTRRTTRFTHSRHLPLTSLASLQTPRPRLDDATLPAMTRLVGHHARQRSWRTAAVAAVTALLLVRSVSASPSSHLAALAPAASADDLAWSECGSISSAALNAVVRTECATFAAPLCHADVCIDTKNRSVNINVRRIKATAAPDSAPSVWLLRGGAGTLSPGRTLDRCVVLCCIAQLHVCGSDTCVCAYVCV